MKNNYESIKMSQKDLFKVKASPRFTPRDPPNSGFVFTNFFNTQHPKRSLYKRPALIFIPRIDFNNFFMYIPEKCKNEQYCKKIKTHELFRTY